MMTEALRQKIFRMNVEAWTETNLECELCHGKLYRRACHPKKNGHYHRCPACQCNFTDTLTNPFTFRTGDEALDLAVRTGVHVTMTAMHAPNQGAHPRAPKP